MLCILLLRLCGGTKMQNMKHTTCLPGADYAVLLRLNFNIDLSYNVHITLQYKLLNLHLCAPLANTTYLYGNNQSKVVQTWHR